MIKKFENERINRYFNGDYSEEDTNYINNIFCDDASEDELKSLLYKQFNELSSEDEVNSKNLEHVLYRLHYDINMNKSKQKIRSFDQIVKWSLRIAGVIMLPIAIFIGINTINETNIKKESWVEIKAPAWTRAQFSLPYGTTGWLNSNSSLKYNGNYNNKRQVTITGEAFFDVTKSKNNPFIVTTNEVAVKVLGTRFNIASYENENNIEVVLEEGKLEFSNKKTGKSFTMKPNDLIVYNKTVQDFTIDEVQPQKYCSWKEGKLVLEMIH